MGWIDRLMRSLNPLHGLPHATCEDFACWYRQAKLLQIRYVAFLTMALYLIYAAIEQNVESDQPVVRLIIHALLVPGILLAIAVLSFQPSRQPLMLGLLSLAPILSVLSNLYFNFGSPRFVLYAPEIYLNLMWTFAISGLTLKRAMATASRRCAARAPLISAAFLMALGRMQGSCPWTICAPSALSTRAKRMGVVSGSSRTRALASPNALSRSMSAAGSAMSTTSRNSPFTLSPILAESMNRVGRPFAGTMA